MVSATGTVLVHHDNSLYLVDLEPHEGWVFVFVWFCFIAIPFGAQSTWQIVRYWNIFVEWMKALKPHWHSSVCTLVVACKGIWHPFSHLNSQQSFGQRGILSPFHHCQNRGSKRLMRFSMTAGMVSGRPESWTHPLLSPPCKPGYKGRGGQHARGWNEQHVLYRKL